MSFILSLRDNQRLVGIHPDLTRMVRRAASISTVASDFVVGRGSVRTLEEQKENMRTGASKTLRSRHVAELNECKLSCAVDLWALDDIDHDTKPDIVWHQKYYGPIAEIMKEAARIEHLQIEWGFDLWKWDGPHFQLPVATYPWAPH